MLSKKEILIQNLIQEGYLKTDKVIRAFREVSREEFVPETEKNFAYADYPLNIGFGQTISAPHMVAIMTELLDPKKTDKVLEIGAGSGYQAAILSKLVKKVYTIELDIGLVEFSKKNLERVKYKNVEVIYGDGSRGYLKEKPYDKILVTCATPQIFQAWIGQLKINGILLAPVGGGFYQTLTMIRKKTEKLEKKNYGGCVFVPLRH